MELRPPRLHVVVKVVNLGAENVNHDDDGGGDSAEDQVKIDTLLDGIADLRAKWVAVDSLKEGKAEAREAFIAKTLPQRLGHFADFLKDDETGFVVGKKISLGDIQLFNFVFGWRVRFPGELEKFPSLMAHHDRVAADPKIAAWLAKRPETSW